MNELWVDIEGYEGKYQVSNLGRVKSLNYNNSHEEKILKTSIVRSKGVYGVHLKKDGKDRKVYVSDLVAKHFLPKDNELLDRVVHINDKLDDSVNNLRWASIYEINFNAASYRRKRENKNIRSLHDDVKELKKWKEIAKENGIKWKTAYERIRIGWGIEEACTVPTNREEQKLQIMLFNYKGKWHSIKQISKITGIKEKTIRRRLYTGWSVEEAFEVPVGKHRGL